MTCRTLERVLITCVLLILPATAGAQVVVLIEGGSGNTPKAIRSWVASDAGLVDPIVFANALGRRGIAGSIGAKVASGGGRYDLVTKATAAGREVGARLLILGQVGKAAGTYVDLLIIDVAGGSIQFDDRISIPLKRHKRKRRRRGVKPDFTLVGAIVKPLISRFGKATTGRGVAAGVGGGTGGDTSSARGSLEDTLPMDENAMRNQRTTGAGQRDSQRNRDIARAGFLLSTGYIVSGRIFDYENGTTNNLRPYEALFVPVLGIGIEVYPAAFVDIDYASDLGLVATYKQALGLKSVAKEDADEVTIGTQWDEFDAGIEYRARAGLVLFGVTASYGQQRMIYTAPAGSRLVPQLPEVEYSYLRGGLETRIGIGDVGIILGGGYRHNLGTGAVGEDYFPSSSTLAFDATIGAGYVFLPTTEVHIRASYSRVRYEMNASEGATYIANGAVDQFFGVEIGITLFL